MRRYNVPLCGKRVFRSEAEAARHVRLASLLPWAREDEKLQRPYLCRQCGHWHLTTPKP